MGDFISSLIGEMFSQIFVDGIFKGLGKVYFKITGNQQDFHGLIRLKRWYLNRNVLLKEDFKGFISKGSKGKVVKIVDENYLLVQFKKSNGDLILYKNKCDIKINRSEVRLIVNKRAR